MRHPCKGHGIDHFCFLLLKPLLTLPIFHVHADPCDIPGAPGWAVYGLQLSQVISLGLSGRRVVLSKYRRTLWHVWRFFYCVWREALFSSGNLSDEWMISLTKTSSERLDYHVFGIAGKLFENVGEWCSFYADILKRSWVIQILSLKNSIYYVMNFSE